MPAPKFSFWDWFDKVETEARSSPVGHAMADHGEWGIAHTGGGCLCWEKILPNGNNIWICNEGNGLGRKLGEVFIVGLYNAEGDFLNATVRGLTMALEQADAYARLGSPPDGAAHCVTIE